MIIIHSVAGLVWVILCHREIYTFISVHTPDWLNCFEIWCNGSTTGFGSVCPGSSPGISTKLINYEEDIFYHIHSWVDIVLWWTTTRWCDETSSTRLVCSGGCNNRSYGNWHDICWPIIGVVNNKLWGRAAVAYKAHNLVVGGSIPSPATKV